MSDAITVAIIVAVGQILGQTVQMLAHRKHERISRDTNEKVNGELIKQVTEALAQGRLEGAADRKR
jgi:hypothetical protein